MKHKLNLNRKIQFILRILMHQIPAHLLEKLIMVFNSQALYMLGAGVSISYITPQYELYDKTKKQISNLIWDALFVGPIPLKEDEEERFKITIGNHTIHKTKNDLLLVDDTYNDLSALFIRQNPEILEISAALNYSVDLSMIKFAPEYMILNMSHPKSLILNFNHDHLAETFIKKRKIISVHGSITPQIRQALQNSLPEILCDRLSAAEVKKAFLKNFCLITQEKEHNLLNTEAYRELQYILTSQKYSFLVIIGYSFFKKNCYSVYDIVSYNLIKSYLRENKKCEVIIIDPDPEFAADILANNLESKIHMYDIRWNCFTHAYCTLVKIKKNFRRFSSDELKMLNISYYQINNK